MDMSERVTLSQHTIKVEHFEEYASGRNWLKVSVSFTDKYGQPNQIISDCYIEKVLLESGVLYWDAEAWKAERVPKLTENVLKRLYNEKRKGNVWKN